MRTERFFVPPEWVAESREAFCIPAGNLHKQIVSVLRMKVGDVLNLLTNDGAERSCRITEITRGAVMGVIAGSTVKNSPMPMITVCAAMTKRDTFEWMLQKCTELGATAFIPLLTDRVVKRPKENPKRFEFIVKEASEQSGRVTIPVIYEPMTLGGAVGHTDGMARVAMHETGGSAFFPKIHKTSEIALFVGPEGGFTSEELAALRDAHAHIVTLGDLVFRAETAAVVGVTKLRFPE